MVGCSTTVQKGYTETQLQTVVIFVIINYCIQRFISMFKSSLCSKNNSSQFNKINISNCVKILNSELDKWSRLQQPTCRGILCIKCLRKSPPYHKYGWDLSQLSAILEDNI